MNSLFIALNMLKRTIGIKRTWLFSLVLPLLVMSGGILFTGSFENKVIVSVLNADTGGLGQRLLDELNDQPEYAFKAEKDLDSLETKVSSGESAAGIVLKEGFTKSLLDGESGNIAFYSVNEMGFTEGLKFKAEQVAERLGSAVTAAKENISEGGDPDVLAKADELLRASSPAGRIAVTNIGLAPTFRLEMATGFLVMFLMMMNNGPVMIMMEDRRNKTFQRISAAPLRIREIVAGQFIGSFVFGTILIVSLLAVLLAMPGFSFEIGFGKLLLVLECFLLASIGFSGVLAGAFGDTGAIRGLNALTIIPTCMLGGCFWPVSFMPEWMQKLANLVPQKWAIEAIRQLSMGAELKDVSMHLAILVLFGAVLLAFGSYVANSPQSQTC
ncbi:ABC transporter permease [Paenibacillus sp. MBLB4367]|uniref:ABC transporter permease n=1 Tax=Paenibacillus sp. MBLB4367 TaxID=3384767 RepID=UPI003907F904